MIKVEVEGFEAVSLRLDGMNARLADLTPAWDEVHQVFLRFEQELFNSEGAYVGERWRPLSPRYAAEKLRKYGDLPILRVTGELMRSFTEPEHESHVYRPTSTGVEMGSRDFKARYHQTGTLMKRKAIIERWKPGQRHGRGRGGRFTTLSGMPPRPPLKPFSRAEGQMIVDILLAHVLRGANPT